MKRKKALALLLALVMAISLTACSSPYVSKTTAGTAYHTFASCYFYTKNGEQVDTETFIKELPARGSLNVQDIYASTEYNERMLYGRYELYNKDADVKKYYKKAEFMEIPVTSSSGNTYTRTVSSLPVEVRMGLSEVSAARYERDHEWAQLVFCKEDGDGYVYVDCIYTVSGNTVTFTILENLNTIMDENYHTLGYEYTLSTTNLTYEFSFDGPRITFSNPDGSITLTSYSFRKGGTPMLGGYLAADSEAFERVDHYNGSHYNGTFEFSTSSSIALEDEKFAARSAIRLYDDGIVDFYWVEKDENGNETVYQKAFVYFGTYPSMVLTDGENVYYYTESYTTRNMASMEDNISSDDLAAFETMDEDAQNEIVEKKNNLLKDLSVAFEEAGLNVNIDSTSGEIALDSTILFGVNEYEISPEGAEFLQKFLAVYTGVVFGEEYTDFVSKILVEGHTDTNGSYEMNLELSQNRADSVLAYCLSEEAGVDPAYVDTLTGILEAVGYAYDNPIYNENGEVDMDASRRVSFRFLVNIGG